MSEGGQPQPPQPCSGPRAPDHQPESCAGGENEGRGCIISDEAASVRLEEGDLFQGVPLGQVEGGGGGVHAEELSSFPFLKRNRGSQEPNEQGEPPRGPHRNANEIAHESKKHRHSNLQNEEEERTRAQRQEEEDLALAMALYEQDVAEYRVTVKTSFEDQLKEARQRSAQQWQQNRGKQPPGTGSSPASRNEGKGMTGSGWQQLKAVRNKHKHIWRSKKKAEPMQQKRVMTLRDLQPTIEAEDTEERSPDAPMSPTKAENIGRECLKRTNEFRAKNGLPPLQWNTALHRIAIQHSKDMASNKVSFGHAGFRERRMRMVPYRYRTMAENVAMNHGFRTTSVARVAVDGWIASPGHRTNLLSRSDYCAIGAYRTTLGRWYLTQLFTGS